MEIRIHKDSDNMNYIVNTAYLNIRRAPEIGRNVITALPQGQVVVLKQKSANDLWWEVSTSFAGSQLSGYVAARYLLEAIQYIPPITVSSIQAVHRQENNPHITRASRASGWSYPLGEEGRPSRNGQSKKSRANDLSQIVNWLQVGYSNRYRPTSNSTYCNIYAHDYCYLAGAYLPRVWWSAKSLIDLAAGKQIVPSYGFSIFEMNANSLYNWLVDFGEQFGWKRIFSELQLQNYANEGKVCLISAKNKILRRSGHICAVVPETAEQKAFHTGSVFSPLTSQAGRNNFQYKTNYSWWYFNTFSHFGFWYHD